MINEAKLGANLIRVAVYGVLVAQFYSFVEMSSDCVSLRVVNAANIGLILSLQIFFFSIIQSLLYPCQHE